MSIMILAFLGFSLPIGLAIVAYLASEIVADWADEIVIMRDSVILTHWRRVTVAVDSGWYHGAMLSETVQQRLSLPIVPSAASEMRITWSELDGAIDECLCLLLSHCYSATNKAFTYLVSTGRMVRLKTIASGLLGAAYLIRNRVKTGYQTMATKTLNNMIDAALASRLNSMIVSRVEAQINSAVETTIASMLGSDLASDPDAQAVKTLTDRKVATQPVNDNTTQPVNSAVKPDATYRLDSNNLVSLVRVNGLSIEIPENKRGLAHKLIGAPCNTIQGSKISDSRIVCGPRKVKGTTIGVMARDGSGCVVYRQETNCTDTPQSWLAVQSQDTKSTATKTDQDLTKSVDLTQDKPTTIATIETDIGPLHVPSTDYIGSKPVCLVLDGTVHRTATGEIWKIVTGKNPKSRSPRAKLLINDPSGLADSLGLVYQEAIGAIIN